MQKSHLLGLSITLITLATHAAPAATPTSSTRHPVILFVWDGLRPDAITPQHTPHLYQLKQKGTWFSDNHSSYPTFTMMNAASFATGDFAGKTGFYGNTLWDPRAHGLDAHGHPVNFKAPVFTEDYKILQDMNQPDQKDPLFFVNTLFHNAHKAGLKTIAVGKSGPAFIQNYQQEAQTQGIVIDERHIYPLSTANNLQKQGYPIPRDTVFAYRKGAITLAANNGNPTGFDKVHTLNALSGGALGLADDFMYADNVTPDPSATQHSPYSRSNRYLMHTYLYQILPNGIPDLSVVWMRNPDTTQHNYGVASPSALRALEDQDQLLGELLAQIKARHLDNKVDLIIASDHGHSNVSGPLNEFPLRLLRNQMVSIKDHTGYSASGDIRPADLLSRAGFHAYDGMGCQYDPVLSGIKSNGTLVYPVQVDRDHSVCGDQILAFDSNGHRSAKIAKLYTTRSHTIPSSIPNDGIVVAGNGGSTYFYLPQHPSTVVKKMVRFLQSRQEFGAIFVDDRYGQVPGTLPMSIIRVLNPAKRNPDVIAGSSFNANATISGAPGIEFNSGGIDRGMHGSFSPRDVHNTLLAIGPDFKTQFVDPLPSGNVDVAPTIAHLLGIALNNTDGRPLLEALINGEPVSAYTVLHAELSPAQPADHIRYQLATNPDGKEIDPSKSHYNFHLHTKWLLHNGQSYTYFDKAPAVRY